MWVVIANGFDSEHFLSHTVELLRLYTLTLLAVFAVRLLVHIVILHRLRRRYPVCETENHPQLRRLLDGLARRMKLRRLPAIHRFPDERPLVFAIGSWRPSIFLAPMLVDRLRPEELEAVLAHELTHVKRGDSYLLWLLEIVFFSIPLLIVQVFALSFIFSVANSVYALLGALAVPLNPSPSLPEW